MELPEDLEMPFPQYACPVCARELPLTEARITVTCAEHVPALEPDIFTIRSGTPDDRHAIEQICEQAWGETEVYVYGRTIDVFSAHNLVAIGEDDKLHGLISLKVDGGDLLVVVHSVYPEHQGRRVGGALIEAAYEHARSKGLPFMKATASNDDIPSLYFYQRHGFVLDSLAVGLLADEIGQAVPGFASIPIRDEIRLRRPVVS